MRKLPVNLLKPGMIVARTVFGPDGQILLQKGVTLKPGYIKRLYELGIPALYVASKWPEDMPEIEDVISDQTRLAAIKLMKEIIGENQEKQGIPSKVVIDTKKVRQVVNDIIDDLLGQRELMLNLADIRSLDDYTFCHSVNVCVLALMTGITLGLSRSDLCHLGVGAILHDVGKIRVPLEILNKPGPLTPEEFDIIRLHPEYGFEILSDYKEISKVSAHIALEHHERYDGSGYPQGLKGSECHEFARITGIVDVYDALTSDRIYRPAYAPHEAYELLAGCGNFRHDYHLVKAFLTNVAAYPVGTPVELNTGEVGLVIGNRRGYSHQPKIRLLSGEEIDLVTQHDRFIVRVLKEEEAERRRLEMAERVAEELKVKGLAPGLELGYNHVARR
ncbi:MAG: hypothetical protein PWP65_1163 [Clostridia bacterium]|nr:hypothetical protein [Clostridia bacterium]